AATALLMQEFCTNLWQKKLSRLEALRQAQLTVLHRPDLVQARGEALLAWARKRGLDVEELRGPKGRLATTLPDDGKVAKAQRRSPAAWWAAFVLSGEWR